MKYIRAKAGFYRYADEKLVVIAAYILQCLEESTVFTDPFPSLVDIKEAYTDYQQKVVKAQGKSRVDAALKRESKKHLADMLQQLVFYVNSVADGNLPLLYSSGFPILAQKRKGQSPDTPTDPYLCDGRISGEVGFGFKPVGRDMNYEYYFSTELDGEGLPIWGEMRITTRSFKAYQSGFTPGKYIFFKVRARNKHGVSHWTSPVMFMVR